MGDKTLIAIVSCVPYVARRAAVRNTWAQTLDVSHAFFVGLRGDTGGAALESDVISLIAPDDYAHLPRKTYALCQYAYERGYTRLIKVDDDTYLRWDAETRAVLSDGDCVGNIRQKPPHTQGISYPQGGCYSLSLRALAAVVSRPYMFSTPGLEDAAVGRALLDEGIPLTHSDLIRTHWGQGEPAPENDIVAAHHVTPEVMYAIHCNMTGGLVK